MTKYELLLAEYDHLDIVEQQMKTSGLYSNGCIWIKQDLPSDKKACILAEELGHYETSTGDILDTRKISNVKQEATARKWAYEKLLPMDDILFALRRGYSEPYDIADFLQVDEAFLKECLKSYGYF